MQSAGDNFSMVRSSALNGADFKKTFLSEQDKRTNAKHRTTVVNHLLCCWFVVVTELVGAKSRMPRNGLTSKWSDFAAETGERSLLL